MNSKKLNHHNFATFNLITNTSVNFWSLISSKKWSVTNTVIWILDVRLDWVVIWFWGHGIINITLLLLLHSHFSAILESIICKKNLKLLFLFINNIFQRRMHHNWAFGVVDTSIRVFKSHLMLPFWKNCILSQRTDSYKLFSLCYSFQILNYAVSLQVIAFGWLQFHCKWLPFVDMSIAMFHSVSFNPKLQAF